MKRISTTTILLLAAAFVALTSLPAMANPLSLGVAGDYNTFVFHNFTATSDTQGRLAVGGNMNVSGYSVGDRLPANSGNVLVVGGDLTYTSGRVYNGDVVVGGSYNGPGYDLASSGDVNVGGAVPIDFAQAQADLIGLSYNLSQMAITGTTSSAYGGITLAGDNTNSLQVFNVSGMDLLNSWGLMAENFASDASILINVSGTMSGLTNFNMEAFADYQNRLLFNFYEAVELSITGVAVRGSILAPLADVDAGSGVIWGTTVANSWEGGVQQNMVTPIPGAVWLLGTGLAGLFVWRRKSRS